MSPQFKQVSATLTCVLNFRRIPPFPKHALV